MSGIDAWAIGVELVLDDRIINQLEGPLYQAFDKVQGAVDAINASIKLTGGAISSAAGQAAALANAFGRAADAAERMQRAASGTGSGQGAPGGGGGGSMPLNAPPGGGGADGGGDGPIPLPGGSNLPALIPGQSYYSGDGILNFQRNPYYGNGGTPVGPDSPPSDYVPNWGPGGQPQDENFNRPGPVPLYPSQSAGPGFDPMRGYFYGQMIYGIANDAIGKPFDAAATVDQKLAILKANGMSPDEAQGAFNLVQQMQQSPQYRTLSVDTLLGILQASFLQTRDVGEAEGILPQLANAATVMQGIGNTGIQSQMFDLLRSGDLAGLLNDTGKDGKPDLTRLNKFIQTFTDIELATGDAVPPAQMVRLFQNLGPAALSMDSEGMGLTMLMALSLGQQKAGTGINQMFKELVGGKMAIPTEKFLEQQGIIAPGKVIGRSGDYVQLAPGALADESDFLDNPVAWFSKHIGGALQSDTPEQREELIHDIYASAGTAQGARVAADAIFQNKLLMRYLTGASDLPPLPVLAQQFDNTPTGAAAAASAAGNALVVTLSNDTMKAFLPMLNFYTGVVNRISSNAQAHPTEAEQGVADAGLGLAWAGLQGWSAAHMPGAGLALRAAGLLGRAAIPILDAELLWDAAGPGSEARADNWGKSLGLPNWMTDPNGISDLFSSGNKPVVDAVNNQTKQIVAAIKGQATTMPTSPTNYNPNKSPPAPGQPLASP